MSRALHAVGPSRHSLSPAASTPHAPPLAAPLGGPMGFRPACRRPTAHSNHSPASLVPCPSLWGGSSSSRHAIRGQGAPQSSLRHLSSLAPHQSGLQHSTDPSTAASNSGARLRAPGRHSPAAAASAKDRSQPPPPDTAPSPATAAAAAAAAAPQLPLCRRPAAFEEELHAVLTWKAQMTGQISLLGDAWEREDGGPDRQGLMRELDWVLDDAIQACSEGPSAPWEEVSWRMLEPRVRAAARRLQDLSGWRLRMRVPAAQLWEWWELRLRERVPFQYLISSAHWHTYVLSVGPGVLIPRPETEIFPDIVRQAVSERPQLAAAPWADLGTGSGAIAISTADVLRKHNKDRTAEVWAVDLSPVAAAYARFNADHVDMKEASNSSSSSRNTSSSSSSKSGGSGDLGRHVHVVVGSWFEPIAHLRGRLGGVLSNPPYIPRYQMAGLQAEVGRHEPSSALDGGEGPGLDSLAPLVEGAAAMLMPGGVMALETAGGEQADLVADMLRVQRAEGGNSHSSGDGSTGGSGSAAESGGVAAFERVEVLEDCYGVRRFVRAFRTGA